MKKYEPTTEDILSVASSIFAELSDEDIQLIKSTHETAQEDDPTATWDLVVENQIYLILYDREPKGPFNHLGYEQTGEENEWSRYHTDGDGDVNLNFLG